MWYIGVSEGKFRIENEFIGINFNSPRVEARFRYAMETLAANPDKSIFASSGTRSQAKAIYCMTTQSLV
jgi:ABC-type uncharacterized transport system fused permease/ATPase subunit